MTFNLSQCNPKIFLHSNHVPGNLMAVKARTLISYGSFPRTYFLLGESMYVVFSKVSTAECSRQYSWHQIKYFYVYSFYFVPKYCMVAFIK